LPKKKIVLTNVKQKKNYKVSITEKFRLIIKTTEPMVDLLNDLKMLRCMIDSYKGHTVKCYVTT